MAPFFHADPCSTVATYVEVGLYFVRLRARNNNALVTNGYDNEIAGPRNLLLPTRKLPASIEYFFKFLLVDIFRMIIFTREREHLFRDRIIDSPLPECPVRWIHRLTVFLP